MQSRFQVRKYLAGWKPDTLTLPPWATPCQPVVY
jgi:hypothetical protein